MSGNPARIRSSFSIRIAGWTGVAFRAFSSLAKRARRPKRRESLGRLLPEALLTQIPTPTQFLQPPCNDQSSSHCQTGRMAISSETSTPPGASNSYKSMASASGDSFHASTTAPIFPPVGGRRKTSSFALRASEDRL